MKYRFEFANTVLTRDYEDDLKIALTKALLRAKQFEYNHPLSKVKYWSTVADFWVEVPKEEVEKALLFIRKAITF